MDPNTHRSTAVKWRSPILPLMAIGAAILCQMLVQHFSPTPLIGLRTTSIRTNPQGFKVDLMMLVDYGTSPKVIAEEIKLAGEVLKVYEPYDTRFKLGEINSERKIGGSASWVTKANLDFKTHGIEGVLLHDRYSSADDELMEAVEALQTDSRADSEKSLLILSDQTLYDAYKSDKDMVKTLSTSKIRISWIICEEETVGVSCKMLPLGGSHWSKIDYHKLGPSASEVNLEGSNVETNVYLRDSSVRFDRPLPLRIEIINKDFANKIDTEGHIYFPGNTFTKKAFHKLGKQTESRFHVDIDLEVHSHISFREVPEFIHFELRDRNGVPVTTTSNAFSFRSDMLAKNIMDWTSDQLKLHRKSVQDYIPSSLSKALEKFYLIPAVEYDLINVCFFGVVGSGKSTTQNTLMTSLRTDEFVETMRPAGGTADHVTVQIEGVDLTQSIKRSNIKMRFWDSFGVSVDNWPDTKFREFLNGRLRTYTVDEDRHLTTPPPVTTEGENLSEIPTKVKEAPVTPVSVPLRERIHSVLLFMPAEIFKNDQLFSRMITSFKIAVSEGFNPLLMVTFVNDLTPSEKDALKDLIISNFNIPKHQVIFVPYYGDKEIRDFRTDFESLYILDRIRNSAESFLESHYPDQADNGSWVNNFGIRSTLVLLLGVLFIVKGIATFLNSRKEKISEPQKIEVPCIADEVTESQEGEEDNEETQIVLIRHVQSTMQIRVKPDTKLKDIISNVAKTFQLEEGSTVFVDEEGVQYPNEATVISCDKIFVKVLTTM